MVKNHSSSKQSSRRRSRSAGRDDPTIDQLDWSIPHYIDAPVEAVDEEILEKIHQTSLKVLEEIGILFLNDEARGILKSIGCDVDDQSENVRFFPEQVLDAIASAPSSTTMTPRNLDRKLTIGGKNFAYSSVASTPNVSDLDSGRRMGNRADYQNMLRLSQYFNCLHFIGGYPVEPIDLHASTRHLDATYDMLTLTDKVIHGYSLGPDRIEDVMEMTRIAGGLSEDEFAATPRMFTNINSTSPLKHDWPMLDGAMRAARRGQVVVVSPFTLSGAMAPATVIGALVQQNAEFFAALVLLQAVRKGTPVIYGAFTSNVDMKSGAPAFGTPEYVRAMHISGQLARRYNLPWRGSNANAANYPDGQAVWESAASIHAISSGHCNFVYHAAGWLEGGLCASFEKLIMDCEMLQQNIYLNQPLDLSEDAFAFEAIREVGPGSHFFGAEHTKQRFKTAFYAPFMSDWRNFETWEETGSVKAEERANKIMKNILAEFTPPPIDPGIDEELTAFVEKRREEGGAPTDF